MADIGQYSSDINFILPPAPTTGDPQEVIQELLSIRNALQVIIYTLLNRCGVSQQNQTDWPQLVGLNSTINFQNLGRVYVNAIEKITAGAIISFYADASSNLFIRNANSTDNTRIAAGYVLSSIDAGVTGEAFVGPGIIPISGVVPGTVYYLAPTNGQVVATKPVAVGTIVQYVGIGIGVNQLFVNPGAFIQN